MWDMTFQSTWKQYHPLYKKNNLGYEKLCLKQGLQSSYNYSPLENIPKSQWRMNLKA